MKSVSVCIVNIYMEPFHRSYYSFLLLPLLFTSFFLCYFSFGMGCMHLSWIEHFLFKRNTFVWRFLVLRIIWTISTQNNNGNTMTGVRAFPFTWFYWRLTNASVYQWYIYSRNFYDYSLFLWYFVEFQKCQHLMNIPMKLTTSHSISFFVSLEISSCVFSLIWPFHFKMAKILKWISLQTLTHVQCTRKLSHRVNPIRIYI